MEAAISTQIPQQFTANDGKLPILGVIFLGLTFTALVYSIVESHKSINALKKSDDAKDKKINNLEAQVKRMMGY
jgi:hypothetical protein